MQSLSSPSGQSRTEALYESHMDANRRRTDGMFAWLIGVQWIAGAIAAMLISPRAWEGAESQMHLHVWAALLLGGAISSLPLFLAIKFPGRTITRHTIAVGQMLTSGLLVHLSGGRIETHFHYFGALAFLSFYRDIRVLITATAITAVDHFLRGMLWPQSVFGVLTSSWWRWMEHAGWVAFEDVFLMLAVRQNQRETYGLAERQAQLELVNEVIEKKVAERTQELAETHQQLVDASRKAGMAEIATNVLHNVGNVLNSVNVSAALAIDGVKKSKASGLAQAVGMMREHQSDLGSFITQDPRGKQLPQYLAQLSEHQLAQQESTVRELDSLRTNIEHIKTIVSMQQTYARVTGSTEMVDLNALVEDCIRLNAAILLKKQIRIERDIQRIAPIPAQKHKVLQILINLVQNAEQSCTESNRPDKTLNVRVGQNEDSVFISVTDNGLGIASENLNRIFNQGFTTKKDGHGFGLHSSANSAKEMGGSLHAASDGKGKGATFTLSFPIETPKKPVAETSRPRAALQGAA